MTIHIQPRIDTELLVETRHRRGDQPAARLISHICLDDESVDFLTLPAFEMLIASSPAKVDA